MGDRENKPSRWPAWVGWLLFALGAAEKLIGWGGSLDFIISRWSDPGWVGTVLRFVAANSAFLSFFMLLAGVALMLWDQRRRFEAVLDRRVTALGPSVGEMQQPLVAGDRPRVQTPEEQRQIMMDNLGKVMESLGLAMGQHTPMRYQVAIAHAEAFLLQLRRIKGVKIPELRANGEEVGALRASKYLIDMQALLMIGEDDAARERAAQLVPRLNAMRLLELRQLLGIE